MTITDPIAHRLDIVDRLRRYAYAIDDRDFDAVRELFTADAILDYRDSGGPRGERDEVIAWIEAGLSGVGPSQHLLANERVDLTDDGARSRCYMFNPLLLSGEPDAPVLLLGGEYRDVWRRSPTGWQIESRVHVVTWTRNLTAT